MNKFFPVILAPFITIPFFIKAEERKLISGKIESGGYGGPVVKLILIVDFIAYRNGA